MNDLINNNELNLKENDNSGHKIRIFFKIVIILIWSFFSFIECFYKLCLYCICSNFINSAWELLNFSDIQKSIRLYISVVVWIFGIWMINKIFEIRKSRIFIIIFIFSLIAWIIYFAMSFVLFCSCFCLKFF